MRSYKLTSTVAGDEVTIYVTQPTAVRQLANKLFHDHLLQASWTEEPSEQPPSRDWLQLLQQLVIRINARKLRTMKKNSSKPTSRALPSSNGAPARGVVAVLAMADALAVNSRETLQQSADLIGRLKALKAKIEEDSADQLEAARATVKKISEALKRKVQPLDEAIELLRNRNQEYEDALKKTAEAAATKANAASLKREEKQRRALAADLIVQGKDEEAARLLNAPSDVQEVRPEPILLDGSAEQKRWRWRVKDIRKVNAAYLTTNNKAITELCGQMGKADEARRNEIRQLLGDGIELEEYTLRAYQTAEVVEDESRVQPE